MKSSTRSALLSAALALLPAAAAHAAWPTSFGGNGEDSVKVVRTSPAGDVFIAGNFSSSIDYSVNGQARQLISRGLQDIYVAKLNAAGQVVWAVSAGGPLTDTLNDMVLDAANNVYVVGDHFGGARFGGTDLATKGLDDGFVAKLDPSNATWQWALSMGGPKRDSATGIAALAGIGTQIPPVPQSVAVVGKFTCSAEFGSLGLTGPCPSDATELFISRVSNTGEWLWARTRGASSSGNEAAQHVAVDADQRLYVVGTKSVGSGVLLSNDFEDGLFGGWTPSVPQFARIAPDPGTGDRVLHMFDGFNEVTSPALNTSTATRIVVSAEILRGFFTFFSYGQSDSPDGGDDLFLEYWNGSTWVLLDAFFGGGGDGERISRSGNNSLVITDPNAMRSDFRIRWRMTRYHPFDFWFFGLVPFADSWHIDDISIAVVGQPAPFVMSVSSPVSNAPVLNAPLALPATLEINDLSVSPDGKHLGIAGTRYGNTTLAPCEPVNGTGAIAMSLSTTSQTPSCEWMRGIAGGDAYGIAFDNPNNAYLTGRFSGSTVFFSGDSGTLQSKGGFDPFIASLAVNGQWRWATGGNRFDEVDGLPAKAGGGGADTGLAVASSATGGIYVGGSFSAVADFGETDTLAAQNLTDGFLLTLGNDGRFFREEKWIAGVPLVPPPGAEVDRLTFQPDFRIAGVPFDAIGARIFTWVAPINGQPAQLIPLQPVSGIEVRWRLQGSVLQDEARISRLGGVAWPTRACAENEFNGCYQVHVVGAPVEAESPTGEYRVLELINPSTGASGASYSGGRFEATRSGTAVLLYINGPALDPLTYPTLVEIVRSLPYDAVPQFVDNVRAEIGKKITDPFHNQPNRTGHVVNELAYYDGHGSEAAYNRSARTGSIIPVNRYNSVRWLDQGRDLAVAWYRSKSKGVYWPEKAVRYAPFWPADPARIVIASQQGSEALGQTRLNPALFPSLRIYIQNDKSLPGYNPNDEHAFMAPSALGSGFEAVFALRSDFGSAQAGDVGAASDPYVLLRYFDNAAQEWKYRVYAVQATGAGFTQFRFGGTAGTTVSPPYPVRLLPGCADTFVVGQARGEQPPPPFFQDYKNQLWGKSAGTGSVHYYYPAQAGFFTDLDNNDENDVVTGTCVPWLARLPINQGGSGSPRDPIAVEYEIAWPDQAPLLISGETLLTPKRGLPDIYNQAAVEVVYDAIQDEEVDPLPSRTVAQLLDPTNPRFVRLAQIPASIAKQFETDGSESIVGSADGTIKLPVSVRDRISYDPLNRRLSVEGEFDESGAGEPFLLLNVLSKRDRVLLKTLDGGDGSEQSNFTGKCQALGCSWDQSIEALFRLSRNPQGIERICEASIINGDRVRVCMQSRLVNENDVLIGYQDENKDYILEPYQAVGVSAALSAGLSQGNGYMTLAFNNDPSLNPLPVSLEIIQVGCLVNPAPPATPTLVSSYQGQINVIAPDDVFDEQLVMRHSGDFGGNPDALEFEWFFHPDLDGTPPMPLPDPANGQLNGWIQMPVPNPQGAVEITIGGANIQTLSDNWYVARYRGLPACNNQTKYSLWAGQPGATPLNQRAQLAQGWVKRVLSRLNPFEARVQDFGQAATNTYASMLVQLGERYSGPIALNSSPDNLNAIGLIDAYTTVMRRALQLSADSTPPIDYGPANAAVLLVASRLVDFYTLLGNEAYADAQDPTVGITTSGGSFSLSPSIFNFQNQLDSLLSEELVLLRGRDDANGPVAASPVYNRLFWNFTTGDGEVAYALSYNITDQDTNGVIDEFDARILFPQGHGDAWGHYLTGTTIYYNLLKHPFYSWDPRPEAVTVAGVPIQVDFLDERQFAQTAAAKARTGAEVVNLTYRANYVEDPDGQWQGYDDVDPERAWGLSEWGRRAGMGAYFDWVTVNAIVPEKDSNPAHVGIQRIQRSTIAELDEIGSHYRSIQGQVDKADAGLNPLGLAQGVVPFDIDPTQLTRFNKTQFEQIYERAMGALTNAVRVWDFANELTNQLRRVQNDADSLYTVALQGETDFNNQLIEIFGYPYVDDIGPGGTYPAGYNGPDLYHYMYIDVPALAGTAFDFDGGIGGKDIGMTRLRSVEAKYTPMPNGIGFFGVGPVNAQTTRVAADGKKCTDAPLAAGCALGDVADKELKVTYLTIESPDYGTWYTKPESWSGQRRAPGRLQQTLQQMLEARVALKQAVLQYDKLRLNIFGELQTLQATFNISESKLAVSNAKRKELMALTAVTKTMEATAIVARRVGDFVATSFKKSSDCVPSNLIAGLAGGGDLFSTVRCAVDQVGSIPKFALDTVADGLTIASNATDAAKEDVSELSGIRTSIDDAQLGLYNIAGHIDELAREEPVLRAEIYARTEALKQLVGAYAATLAEGQRALDRLLVFRRDGAAETQIYRLRDMAFRIFRNDALQKYRAAFDLAARYVYLAASAYDYETNLLGSNTQAGQKFLTNVVRERSLGQVLQGSPMPGSPGLADTMAQLKLNFDVLKGQMGFNNPQTETNRFSLRRELFRIPDGAEGDDAWRRKLESMRVPDLWKVPEFRRFARPFAPESAGPQPGLVIEFPTNVTFGMNFFGWDLGPQDSSYDSSQFATRVRSVGAWFAGYAGLPLADDPRIYLFPVGADVLRSPSPNDFTTREWQVVDQAIPTPFPIGASALGDFAWNPSDTLSESPTNVRRYARFRAYNYTEPFDDSQVTSDSRLIGRSVWNRRWVMVIPGGTFLNDPTLGLDTFINGRLVPGGSGVRDGNGVDDIYVFFKTYAYTGQ